MSFPMTMNGHARTYQPPRALRSDVRSPVTAWELFSLLDGPAKEWADATLDGLIASIDTDSGGTLGCTDCRDTGFYGSVDRDDEDFLTGLVRRVDNGVLESLTASGTWQPWEGTDPLEVLSLDLAADLASAITAGACGLVQRYASPKAFLAPTDVVAATRLGEHLSALTASTPQAEWVNLAVVDELDQGAVLDLVQITAAGDAARWWDGCAWIPDEDLLMKADLPMVRLDGIQLAEIQAQIHPAMTAAGRATRPQKCHYCSDPATKSILHAEGMAYIPVCDEHLEKGTAAAKRSTPDGSRDPSNIVAVRPITAALEALVADAPLTVSPDPRAEKLRRYWSTGKGAAKIRWNTPGDWKRCYRHLAKYMGLRAKGYCQNLHKRNDGVWTGDRRNPGGNGHRGHHLIGSAISPEESLLASVQAHRWVREQGRNHTMTDTAIADGIYSEADPATVGIMNTLVAGGFPVKPPQSWFENPKLTGPTPIDVTDEGRVFGHIAPWGVNHIGMAGSVVTPKNADGKYAFFRTGALRTEEGTDVHVGQLTLVGGHAPISATAAQAVRHYDDTNSAVADVVVGEDQYGIWAAGALRPNVTPEQVRAMRACPPSGDWRPVNGRLELVAACHVNVQGFPIAKAMYASGAITALVAAGTREMYLLKASRIGNPDLVARVEELAAMVASLQASAAVAEAPVEAAPAEAVAEPVAEEIIDAEVVTEDEGAEPTEAELARADKIAQARDLVAGIQRDALRARVRGSAAPVVAALPPQFLAHKKGADGKEPSTIKGTDSFPISDVASLKRAIQAFGRAGDKDAAKKHIVSMAYKLKRPDLIPSNWKK